MIHEYAKQHCWQRSIAWFGIVAVLGLGLTLAPAVLAQQQETPAQPAASEVREPVRADENLASDSQPASVAKSPVLREAVRSTEPAVQPEPKNPSDYGLWTLLPAAVAILLAIFTRQVVPALVVGVLTGAYMMLPCLPASDPYTQVNSVVGGFRLAMEKYVLGAIHEQPGDGYNHIKIMVFTLVIGFTIGVIGRNGGTTGMVKLVVGESTSPRRSALTAWFAGLVVFFDDYANTMIVGPTMRSVFDRAKLSRAKLAYIVDSTAAPVASIALIGTWVGAEITWIQSGIDAVVKNGTPGFLIEDTGQVSTGMTVFINSLAYRFYPILALVLVFLVALTGRDFGPMKRAERNMHGATPRPGEPGVGAEDMTPTARPTWWLGALPIGVLIVATVIVLTVTGYGASNTVTAMQAVGPDGANLWEQKGWWEQSGHVLQGSDSSLSIFYGAILSAFAAVVLTMIARACSVRDAVDAGIDGMCRMFPAIVILILAWAISSVLQELQLGQIVAAKLIAAEFPAQWLPLAVFLCAALISFATGTSWGTMGILCPVTVQISAGLFVGDFEQAEAMSLFYASVGSVLAGAIFGDHCSPISDTTILSSIAAGCRHEEHVWTQMPYALVAAVAAMGLGDVLCSVYGEPWYLGLAAGTVFLIFFIFLFGRKTAPMPASVPSLRTE